MLFLFVTYCRSNSVSKLQYTNFLIATVISNVPGYANRKWSLDTHADMNLFVASGYIQSTKNVVAPSYRALMKNSCCSYGTSSKHLSISANAIHKVGCPFDIDTSHNITCIILKEADVAAEEGS